MTVALVAVCAPWVALFAAVAVRGWPNISDGFAGGTDDEPVERTPAIGFGFQVPELDDEDDE